MRIFVIENHLNILFCIILRHFCLCLSAMRPQSDMDAVRLSNGSSQNLFVYESQSQHLMAYAIVERFDFNIFNKCDVWKFAIKVIHLQVCNIMSTSAPTSRTYNLIEIIFNTLYQINVFNWISKVFLIMDTSKSSRFQLETTLKSSQFH